MHGWTDLSCDATMLDVIQQMMECSLRSRLLSFFHTYRASLTLFSVLIPSELKTVKKSGNCLQFKKQRKHVSDQAYINYQKNCEHFTDNGEQTKQPRSFE